MWVLWIKTNANITYPKMQKCSSGVVIVSASLCNFREMKPVQNPKRRASALSKFKSAPRVYKFSPLIGLK